MFSAVCRGGGFAERGLLGVPFLNSPRDGRRHHIVSWQVAFLMAFFYARRSVRRAALWGSSSRCAPPHSCGVSTVVYSGSQWFG